MTESRNTASDERDITSLGNDTWFLVKILNARSLICFFNRGAQSLYFALAF